MLLKRNESSSPSIEISRRSRGDGERDHHHPSLSCSFAHNIISCTSSPNQVGCCVLLDDDPSLVAAAVAGSIYLSIGCTDRRRRTVAFRAAGGTLGTWFPGEQRVTGVDSHSARCSNGRKTVLGRHPSSRPRMTQLELTTTRHHPSNSGFGEQQRRSQECTYIRMDGWMDASIDDSSAGSFHTRERRSIYHCAIEIGVVSLNTAPSSCLGLQQVRGILVGHEMRLF